MHYFCHETSKIKARQKRDYKGIISFSSCMKISRIHVREMYLQVCSGYTSIQLCGKVKPDEKKKRKKCYKVNISYYQRNVLQKRWKDKVDKWYANEYAKDWVGDW